MWNQLKLPKQTIRVNRNGYIFQIDPYNPSVRYKGGDTDITTYDPYEGTGVRELYKQLAGQLSSQIGKGVTPYPGQIVPGASSLQQQGFGLAQGLGPMATGAGQFFGDTLGQVDPGMTGRAMGTAEQTLQNVLQPFDPKMLIESLEPARKFGMDVYKQDVMPAIAEKYFSGGEGGAGYRELARGGERLSSGLAAQLASYIYPASEAQKGREQIGVGQAMQMAGMPGQIAGQAGQVGGMGTDILSQMLNIGGQQRDITAQQMQEPYQKWQQAQPYNNPWLQYMGQALSQPPMGMMAQQQGPGWSSMLPGLGSFLGGWLN